MVYILHGFSNVSDEFKPSNIKQDIIYLESPVTKKRIWGWILGSIRAISVSKRGDTIFCWYDFQAVLIFWICFFSLKKRNIGCLNILLKKKKTITNRLISIMYKVALSSKNFHASVTSPFYGELLNEWLGIKNKYTIIHDPFHECWERKGNCIKSKVFCGGNNARDWDFIINVAKELQETSFLFVMNRSTYLTIKDRIPHNVEVQYNVPFDKFLYLMANSAMVVAPLTTEAPAGLLVIYQAAGCNTFVISSLTATTKEYITEERGCALPKDINKWKEAISYYMFHKEEREEKALRLHEYLKTECSRINFDKGIQTIIDLCESNK